MSDHDDIAFLDATEMAAAIREKTLSPVEIVDACLGVIAARNQEINAVVTLVAERARAAAARAEKAVMRGDGLGLLTGLPIGIKDITPTAGIRTTFGSPLFAEHVPDEDALVVRRLKRAGAIIVGKTNTPQFAAGGNTDNPVFGATHNPWDLTRSAGGSTGGGAAALASGMIPLSDGSDFGGSLRQPAALCGVVGLRPTPGVVPTHPNPLPWNTLSVAGPMARTAADVALLLDAMAGPSPTSPLSVALPQPSARAVVDAYELAGRRFAYAPDISGVGIDGAIGDICRQAAERLAKAGAAVEEVALDLSPGHDAFLTLRGQINITRHADDLDDPERFGPRVADDIRRGLAQTVRDLASAELARAELWRRLAAVLDDYDAVLTPCVPVQAVRLEEDHPKVIGGRPVKSYLDWLAPTFVISLCGVPAASAPAGRDADGLPVGLQIVGRRLADADVLGIAKHVQRLSPIGRPG